MLLAVAVLVGGWALFGVGSGVLLGVPVGVGALVLLARRKRRDVEAAQREVEAHVKARRFERAVERLESLRPVARWIPYVASSIDQQVGALRYAALDDPEGAAPYLERARMKSAESWAMLAASLFRRRRYEEMQRTFDRAVRRRRKDAVLWGAYAWCEWRRGEREAALRVLARARTRLPSDERLQRMQLALQNDRDPKMRPFGPEWYALRLEPAPAGGGAPSVSPDHPALRGMRRGRVRVRRG